MIPNRWCAPSRRPWSHRPEAPCAPRSKGRCPRSKRSWGTWPTRPWSPWRTVPGQRPWRAWRTIWGHPPSGRRDGTRSSNLGCSRVPDDHEDRGCSPLGSQHRGGAPPGPPLDGPLRGTWRPRTTSKVALGDPGLLGWTRRDLGLASNPLAGLGGTPVPCTNLNPSPFPPASSRTDERAAPDSPGGPRPVQTPQCPLALVAGEVLS